MLLNEAMTRPITVPLSYTKQWLLVENVWRRNLYKGMDKTDRINKMDQAKQKAAMILPRNS
jgi:hypothetical protein